MFGNTINRCCNACCCPKEKVQYSICYCSRYVDMPMSVYYGSGYTELDCCEDTLGVLKEISATLKKCCGGNSCGCCR